MSAVAITDRKGVWDGLAALVAFTAYYYVRYRSEPEGPGDEISSRQLKVGDERGDFVFRVLAALLVVLIIVTLGNYLRSLACPRVFEGEGLDHLVGRIEGDGSSVRGRAVHGDVASDEAGYLAYSEYEMFPPANYQVCYNMRIGETLREKATIATIDAITTYSVLASREVKAGEFEEADVYQDFCLDFHNPSPQALQFRVFFTDMVDLWVDAIRLTHVEKKSILRRQ